MRDNDSASALLDEDCRRSGNHNGAAGSARRQNARNSEPPRTSTTSYACCGAPVGYVWGTQLQAAQQRVAAQDALLANAQ
ncbi:DUF7373 family lipoprotein [Nocardia sp. NBC_00508]|uniref:DUF7373 family lipoprotein n=1 Tax=Nocardia sp. NBC_00508 TaxID=2975992 RepID=UPI003FA5876D